MLSVTLSPEEFRLVMAGLEHLPIKHALPLYSRLQLEAQRQQPASSCAEPPPVPARK